MKSALLPLVLACLVASLFGCAHSPSKQQQPSVNPYGAQALPPGPIRVNTQLDRALNVNGATNIPTAGYMAPSNQPIYNNPKIGKVVLAPHIDKNGRMYGPQEMYQVADEGGWNLEALEPGANGYIPAANVEIPSNIGNPIAAAARRAPPLPPESLNLIDDIDPATIVITGLLSASDEPQVNTMAAEQDMITKLDDQLGWILIPRKKAR